jgi:hypothetical protein
LPAKLKVDSSEQPAPARFFNSLLRKSPLPPQGIDRQDVAYSAQAGLNQAKSEILAKKIRFPAGFGCSLQLA